MADIINVGKATPKGFMDFSRPRPMINADKIFNRLFISQPTTRDALDFTSKMTGLLKKTKYGELNTLWTEIEKTFNKGKALNVEATTPVGHLQTALSMFYNALDVIDEKAVTTGELSAFRSIYLKAKNHVQNRYLTREEGRNKRTLERIIKTIDTRLEKVVKRFNEGVDAGKVQGTKIE